MAETKAQLDQHDQPSEKGVTVSDSLERLRAIARGEDVPVQVESTDVKDECNFCGTEVPPGPDFCSPECEQKAEQAMLDASDPSRLPESRVLRSVQTFAENLKEHVHGVEHVGPKPPSVAEQMAEDVAKKGQKQLTETQFRALRRAYFTVRHPQVRECGHKMDQINQPKNNCEYCWFAFFSSHGELVQTADRAFQEQGSGFLDSMRGVKFRKYFLRYMSTMAKFQREADALKENDGNQGRETGSESGEAESGSGVRRSEHEGTEDGSDQISGRVVGQAVRNEGDVSTPGQDGGQTTTVDTQ